MQLWTNCANVSLNVNTLSKTALVLVTALLLPLILISNAGIVSPRGAVTFPSAVLPPAPKYPRVLRVSWDYPNEVIMNIEFEVQHQTNATIGTGKWEIVDPTAQIPKLRLVGTPTVLSTNWFPFTNTPNLFFEVTANKPSEVFRVRARDKRTGKVSDWAGN